MFNKYLLEIFLEYCNYRIFKVCFMGIILVFDFVDKSVKI